MMHDGIKTQSTLPKVLKLVCGAGILANPTTENVAPKRLEKSQPLRDTAALTEDEAVKSPVQRTPRRVCDSIRNARTVPRYYKKSERPTGGHSLKIFLLLLL